MERIQSINPDRILWCCSERNISPEELAAEVGIAEATFRKVMAGEVGITFKQLQKVASYLGRGALFFLEADPVTEDRVHSPQFRTIANQKPQISSKLRSLIERVERQRELYLSLLEDLGDNELPGFSPPQLPDNNIPLAARIAREWLGLIDSNNFDSYRRAVEAKSILVFRSNGYSGAWQIDKKDPICGFTLFHFLYPVIVVKKQLYESRQSFTMMHELGHLLLHRSSFIDEEADLYSYQGIERDANAFAGNLLVPDVFLSRVHDRDRPGDVSQLDNWLKPLRFEWGVSGEVILRRLLDTGRLPQSTYDDYRKWRLTVRVAEKDGGSRQYRYREPKHVFGEPFVRTVLDALHAKQISLSRASTYLDNLKISDVHQLESFYANL